MIKVTIADVIRNKQALQNQILLLNETGGRALCIWIGAPEAESIAIHLANVATERPITHSFIVSLLEATGSTLEEVRIEKLVQSEGTKDGIFYAVVRVRSGDRVHEIDARPSDALGWAVRTGIPIYATDDVMNQAGLDVAKGDGSSTERIILVISAAVSGVEGTSAELQHYESLVTMLKQTNTSAT